MVLPSVDCKFYRNLASTYGDKYWLFKKAGGRLALSLYDFLHTAFFHFEWLELVHVDMFKVRITNVGTVIFYHLTHASSEYVS